MLRHERQTVEMELAAALHHSHDGGRVTNHGLRAPKTASSGGRPGVLKEPEPQGGAVTVGYVAAPGPLLEAASMAWGDSVDGTALRFLVKKALERQKEEEQEKEKVMEELDVLMRIPFIQLTSDHRAVVERPGAFQDWRAWSAASSAGRRKKKRKKQKLPKSSSGPLHRQGWRRGRDRVRPWPT